MVKSSEPATFACVKILITIRISSKNNILAPLQPFLNSNGFNLKLSNGLKSKFESKFKIGATEQASGLESCKTPTNGRLVRNRKLQVVYADN